MRDLVTAVFFSAFLFIACNWERQEARPSRAGAAVPPEWGFDAAARRDIGSDAGHEPPDAPDGVDVGVSDVSVGHDTPDAGNDRAFDANGGDAPPQDVADAGQPDLPDCNEQPDVGNYCSASPDGGAFGDSQVFDRVWEYCQTGFWPLDIYVHGDGQFFMSVPEWNTSRVVSVDGQGKEVFSTTLPGLVGIPAMGEDGFVYLISDQQALFALDRTGRVVLNVQLHEKCSNFAFSPSIGQDGTLYAAISCQTNSLDGGPPENTGVIAAVKDGKIKWKIEKPNSYWVTNPVIDAEGNLYTTDIQAGTLDSYDAAGAMRWTIVLKWQEPVFGGWPLVLGRDAEYVFFSTKLIAVDRMGRKLWEKNFPEFGNTNGPRQVLVDQSDNAVVAASVEAGDKYDASLYVLDRCGKVLASKKIPGVLIQCPLTLVSDGSLYLSGVADHATPEGELARDVHVYRLDSRLKELEKRVETRLNNGDAPPCPIGLVGCGEMYFIASKLEGTDPNHNPSCLYKYRVRPDLGLSKGAWPVWGADMANTCRVGRK
ncbi:MAG: hypothetical protein HY897_08020 [Deltaproteobacteria bacterium]|nr:hypothetical protein [Deltaproteobacteria bacterium]